MKLRNIERIIRDPYPHWVGNGFNVKQYFPGPEEYNMLERFSPFILMDYNAPYFFKGTPFETGVGPHPHRGFETVTFALAGKVAHGDNAGNSGVIESGDVQWMTAGSGILHKEYHEKEYAKQDRVLHMIQLWVNLPKAHKMTAPKYQAITAKDMGSYESEDESLKAIIYAGEAFGQKGPASTFSPMNIYKVELAKAKEFLMQEPEGYNTGILLISGKVKVNGEQNLNPGDFVLFANDGDSVQFEGLEESSEIFVLSGQPLNERAVAMGPFVMSSEEEIIQANIDFREGKFGSYDF